MFMDELAEWPVIMRKKIAQVTLRKTNFLLQILKLNSLFFFLSIEPERLFGLPLFEACG